MIPTFPEFKKIEISDKDDIENFTKNFPPYSDFNFIALFCWDVEGKRRISMLNGNLVVRLTDDTTGKEFLSFLGTNQVPETIRELLKYSKKEGLKPVLKMIPQETTNYCADPGLSIEVRGDRDNFDYIYEIQDLCNYEASKYSHIRHKCNKFTKRYGDDYHAREFELHSKETRHYLSLLWKEWCDIKEFYSEREGVALYRLISNGISFDLANIMLFVGEKPVGFSINKIVSQDCAINFFAKASYSYLGANPILMRETAKSLAKKGCKLLNFEEDLGLPGLRRAKEAYKPSFFLRKYDIRRIGLFQKIITVV